MTTNQIFVNTKIPTNFLNENGKESTSINDPTQLNQNARINTLQNELMKITASFLPPKDLKNLALTCKTTHQIITTSSLNYPFSIADYNHYSMLKRIVLLDEVTSLIENFVVMERSPINTLLNAMIRLNDRAVMDWLHLNKCQNMNCKDRDGWNALVWAFTCRPGYVELFLDNGISSLDSENFKGKTALLWAIGTKNRGLIEKVLKKGADPNKSIIENDGDMRSSPLVFAIRFQSLEILELLLKYGAKINVHDRCNEIAPIGEAVEIGNYEIIEFLLKHGADPNGLNDDGTLPLSLALHFSHFKDSNIVKLLFDYNVNVNALCADGTTTLHYALNAGTVDHVQFLLEHGANPLLKSPKEFYPDEDKNKTALDIAKQRLIKCKEHYDCCNFSDFHVDRFDISSWQECVSILEKATCKEIAKTLMFIPFMIEDLANLIAQWTVIIDDDLCEKTQ